MRIGIGHKALFAANSMAIGKKSNAVDYPSPRQRKPQGVMQSFLKTLRSHLKRKTAGRYRCPV